MTRWLPLPDARRASRPACRRRALRVAFAGAAAAMLAGCGTPSVPALRFYRLPLEATRGAPDVAAAAASGPVWQLMLPVRIPEHLDRDAILVAQGAAGLQPQAGHRWAEPLRDALPRVLRRDLARAWGESRVWTTPLPAGLVVQRQLRVDVLRLETTPDGGTLRLDARWSMADPEGRQPPVVRAAGFDVPLASASVDALVLAHREAMARLASAIVASAV